jgi:hypothetical protein
MNDTKTGLSIIIEAPANGRVKKAVVQVLDAEGHTKATDAGDLMQEPERGRVARSLTKQLAAKGIAVDKDVLYADLEAEWNRTLDERRRVEEQAKAGSPEAEPRGTVSILDTSPASIRRPLSLINGRAYAAAWLPVQRKLHQTIEAGRPVFHVPPLVIHEEVLCILTADGTLYADNLGEAPPLADLGLPVRLPSTLPPGKGWSGAGVKRYLAGQLPKPADVFGRVKAVVDRFIDFDRSLAPQEIMCELVACYVLGTYFLDAFHVIGYVWSGGERGSGKTSLIGLMAELAYLGQLILASTTQACLRDMADYGAFLAFDDAEAVMDFRRIDPDKRAMMLAGNRRGVTVAVKELQPDGQRWATRYVDAFCPKAFSAIRPPDPVLGSRSIITPLVRSVDERRAKGDCTKFEDWPCDRGQLIDDLWALGLRYLPALVDHDRRAAAAATLVGRSLDTWRSVLAVAHWLQERHGVAGLFDRLEQLSVRYDREELGEYENDNYTRVLFRVLLTLPAAPDGTVFISPGDVASAMNNIAWEEHMVDETWPNGELKDFISAKRVGHLCKNQRFHRPKSRSNRGKQWITTRQEIEKSARSFGVSDGDKASGEADTAGQQGDEGSLFDSGGKTS